MSDCLCDCFYTQPTISMYTHTQARAPLTTPANELSVGEREQEHTDLLRSCFVSSNFGCGVNKTSPARLSINPPLIGEDLHFRSSS